MGFQSLGFFALSSFRCKNVANFAPNTNRAYQTISKDIYNEKAIINTSVPLRLDGSRHEP